MGGDGTQERTLSSLGPLWQCHGMELLSIAHSSLMLPEGNAKWSSGRHLWYAWIWTLLHVKRGLGCHLPIMNEFNFGMPSDLRFICTWKNKEFEWPLVLLPFADSDIVLCALSNMSWDYLPVLEARNGSCGLRPGQQIHWWGYMWTWWTVGQECVASCWVWMFNRLW